MIKLFRFKLTKAIHVQVYDDTTHFQAHHKKREGGENHHRQPLFFIFFCAVIPRFFLQKYHFNMLLACSSLNDLPSVTTSFFVVLLHLHLTLSFRILRLLNAGLSFR
jgi:hypothetical protein